MSVPYDDRFATDLFATWETILTEWDDKKSHEITDKHIRVLQQACHNLVELGRDVQIEINRLSDECDAII